MTESPRPPLRLQHVAALCDLSPVAINAAWRAALAARELELPLRLICPCPQAAQRVPPSIAGLQSRIAEQLGVPITLELVKGDALGKVVEATRGGLLVVPSVRGNPIREFIMGTQAERVIRLARGPVLVVKQAASVPYRRVFIASDLQPRSELLVAAGGALARRAQLVVFHALAVDGDLTGDDPDNAVRVLRGARLRRDECSRAALVSLAGLADARDARDLRPLVAFGAAASAIAASAQSARAHLVVVGKRRRGLLADFFLGGVTQRVLASVVSDVLVVPTGPAPAASTTMAAGTRSAMGNDDGETVRRGSAAVGDGRPQWGRLPGRAGRR